MRATSTIGAVTLVGALITPWTSVVAGRQPPSRPDGRLRPNRAISDHDARGVVAELDPARLEAGRVKAVVDGGAITATASLALTQAARGAVFVDRVRDAAVAMAPPATLATAPSPDVANPISTLLANEIVLADAAGATAVRSKVFVSDTSGLTFSGVSRTFHAQIGVAFVNVEAENDQSPLPRAVSVLIKAPGATVSPHPIEVLQLGRWYTAQLSVAAPSEPFRVAASAIPSDPGEAVTLSILRPHIALAPTTRRIVGYGLGTVTVTVIASNLSDPDGLTADIVTDRGNLQAGGATLDSSGRGRVALRSAGVGTASLSPIGVFEGEPVTIEFASPWSFLVLAGLGGVAGAFLQKKGRKHWTKGLAISVLAAMVMTVAYAAGLDWVTRSTGWSTLADSGEAVVFVLGLLGSLVGVQALTASA